MVDTAQDIYAGLTVELLRTDVPKWSWRWRELTADQRHAFVGLRGADLRGANLAGTTICGAVIDGAIVHPDHIGGPGHILCALTDEEWRTIQNMRQQNQKPKENAQ